MEREAPLPPAAASRHYAGDPARIDHRRARASGNWPSVPLGLSRVEAVELLKQYDETGAAAATWPCAVGPITLRFPNFPWRRRAIAAHDLHHLMTGYPMTMRGECQMAAWEFGAGRYRHWGATLFCAPLIMLGLFWSPVAMMRAYRSGLRSESLYSILVRVPE